MTAHAHDPAVQGESPRPAPAAGDATATTAARPRWLLPGLAVAIIAGALVVAGVLPLSTVLYAGLLGGMLLMHLGGHGGHAGHGSQGSAGGHAGHGGGATPDDGGGATPGDGDERSSHGCH